MKNLSVTLSVFAIGLAVVMASPAEAAKKKQHHQPGYASQAMVPGGTSGRFQGGVLGGGRRRHHHVLIQTRTSAPICSKTSARVTAADAERCLILPGRCAQLPASL